MWVCEHLDNVVNLFISEWLELLISATLSNINLPQTIRFKFPFSRKSLEKSQIKDITAVWKSISNHTNIQLEVYRNTEEVLKPLMVSMKTDSRPPDISKFLLL